MSTRISNYVRRQLFRNQLNQNQRLTHELVVSAEKVETKTLEPFRSGVEPQAQRLKVMLLMIDLEN
eukprot:4668715-Ditylum_brightwellii.AAC.1